MAGSIHDLKYAFLQPLYGSMSLDDLTYRHSITAPVSTNYIENRMGITFADLSSTYPDMSVDDALYQFYLGGGVIPSEGDFFLNLFNPVNVELADDQGIGTLVVDDFFLNLSNPVNVTLADDQGVGEIVESETLISPGVAMSRSSGVAPLALHFDATATTASSYTSRPIHALEYRWDFGDEEITTWSYGARPGVLLKNIAFGPVSSHVYRTAGTYSPSLQIRFRLGDGSYDVVTYPLTTVTVTAADTQWAGSKTICVSTSGDFTGAPAGSTHVTSSNATTSISGNIGTGDVRILFRRDETFGVAAAITINKPGPCMIGDFGTGDKPIFNRTAGVTMMNLSSGATPTQVYDWRFQNIVFEGGSYANAGISGEGSCKRMLFLDCDVQNVSYGYTFAGSILDSLNSSVPFTHAGWDELYIVDSTIYNLIGVSGPCGIFASGDRLVVMGSNIDNNGGGEHGCRTQYTNRQVFSNNTIDGIALGKANFSIRGGAFDGGDTWPAGIYSEKNVISDNHFIGTLSAGIVGIGPQNSDYNERGRNMIFERNLLIGSLSTVSAITCAQPDITFRSNVALMSSGTFLALEKSDLVPVPTNIHVYHNTMYADGLGGVYLVGVAIGAGTGFEESPVGTCVVVAKNNLAYAPDAIGYSSMFVNVENVGDFTGNSNNTSTLQMFSTDPNFTVFPPTTIEDCIPTSGYALSGGTAVDGVYEDILGVAIPTTPDIGALVA